MTKPVSDIVERLRKFWREVTEDDGGESPQMVMTREAADEIERLRRTPPEREVVMEAALRDCRSALAEQIEADLDFCCPKLPDGSPDEDEMDEESRPMIEATKALVAKIDSALSEGENKVVIAKTEDGVVEALLAALKEILDMEMGRGDGVVGDYIEDIQATAQAAIEAYERARGVTGTSSRG